MTNFLIHDRNPHRWYFTLAKGIKSTKRIPVYKQPIPQIYRLICTDILYNEYYNRSTKGWTKANDNVVIITEKSGAIVDLLTAYNTHQEKENQKLSHLLREFTV